MQNLFVDLILIISSQTICEHLGFLVLELVVGCGEQDKQF